MTDPTDERNAPGPVEPALPRPLPRAVIRENRRISIVWLIPIIAALSGAFLAWKAISERGPRITILLDSAEGLEAEKTKIKYRNVEVGIIDAIGFNQDLSKVEASASLAKWTEPYLTEQTSFWVVTARISAGEISELGTLLGGAYIGMAPSQKGAPMSAFVAASKPPIVSSEEAGSFFELQSEDLGSIGIGAPVYYRSLEVGRLVEEELDSTGELFSLRIFVEAPHDRRITSTTLFWNASGIDATFDVDGARLESPSIVSMLIGGIEFGLPPGAEPGEPPLADEPFVLYESKRAAFEPRFVETNRYLLRFGGSVAGLRVGAPVEFRGIRLGQVVDLTLTYDFETGNLEIPVLIDTQPGRVLTVGNPDPEETQADRIDDLVRRGLRARLATDSFLTGQLKIDLDFVEGTEPAEIVRDGLYPEIPTVPAALEGVTDSLAATLDRIEQIPFEEIGQRIDHLLAELEGFATQINREVTPSVVASLETLETTLLSAEAMIGPDSTTPQDLDRILREASAGARALRVLLERLERHPEELIRGKSK